MGPLEIIDIQTEIIKLQADVIYKQTEALEQAKIAESLAEDLRDERAIIEELCKRAGVDITNRKAGTET